MTPFGTGPVTQDQGGDEPAPISSAAAFSAAMSAAKEALSQPVPDSRDAWRTLLQSRKRTKRLLAPARKVRLASLAPGRPSAHLQRALVPLNRILSARRRQRWMLELRLFVRRSWIVLLLLAVLMLIWAFWTPILAVLSTLAQDLSW